MVSNPKGTKKIGRFNNSWTAGVLEDDRNLNIKTWWMWGRDRDV
jgi:hypothetical protein